MKNSIINALVYLEKRHGFKGKSEKVENYPWSDNYFSLSQIRMIVNQQTSKRYTRDRIRSLLVEMEGEQLVHYFPKCDAWKRLNDNN